MKPWASATCTHTKMVNSMKLSHNFHQKHSSLLPTTSLPSLVVLDSIITRTPLIVGTIATSGTDSTIIQQGRIKILTITVGIIKLVKWLLVGISGIQVSDL